MKNLIKYIIGIIFFSTIVSACYEDQGNYTYLSDEEVEAMLIEIDTTGLGSERFAFSGSYNGGDVIKMSPKVHYRYPENLKYSWISYPYPYTAVEVGNTSAYPVPDTLSHELEIEWTVDKEPGRYTVHLLVEDPIEGVSSSMNVGGYFTINKPGVLDGVYVLSEYDGQTDIEYFSSSLCLIYNGDTFTPNYYSKELGHGMLPGKPLFMSYGDDYYYVFTEEDCYRLNFAGLELMETFDEMFYAAPNYAPQAMHSVNNCEFLINDGKLHVLYTNKGNDRKFSAPISGNYQAGTYLNDETRTTWRPVSGAIDADQIIFDELTNGFRPYYPQAAEVGEFKPTASEAFVNAKALPSKPVAMQGGEGGKTYAILHENGKPYLYRMNFYNVVDDGDLSSDGKNSVIDLSNCEEIMNMKHFLSSYQGSAFFYATDNALYSFSPTSGSTNSNFLYRCEEGEEITAMNILCRGGGGGFPTSGCALWVGVWNESTKEGKIVEFEIDAYSGLLNTFWGPMFGGNGLNPNITTGFGKIKGFVARV